MGSATNIPVLDKGFVRLIDHMGDDLRVVNAARVSFAKESDFIPGHEAEDWLDMAGDKTSARYLAYKDYVTKEYLYEADKVLNWEDWKLIHYLSVHKHWTPFAHPQVCLHFKMPIFVARQFYRHTVGIVYNEVSRRYVDDTPEFYEPEVWRGRPPKSLKQGSSGEKVERLDPPLHPDGTEVEDLWGGHDNDWKPFLHNAAYNQSCLDYYNWQLKSGIAPEQARMCLPQSTYTEFWATMSLAAAARIYGLRSDPHAQLEIQQYAHTLDAIIRPLFPVSWPALVLPSRNGPSSEPTPGLSA